MDIKNSINLKHWSETDRVGNSQIYLESDNKKLWTCIVTPHSGNDYKFMLRIAVVENFDKWSYAEIQKYFDSFDELIDYLTSVDVNAHIPSWDEQVFYESNKDIEWTACHCEQIVSGKPHYRDAEDERDYFICPICGEKLYVED